MSEHEQGFTAIEALIALGMVVAAIGAIAMAYAAIHFITKVW